MDATEINTAIAQGFTVTARAADLVRPGQPNRGVEVRIIAAFDGRQGDTRCTAQGFKGRFRVENVNIRDGQDRSTEPDTY